jgi:hypothetical protein
MSFLNIFKGNDKDKNKDCCKIEIVEVSEEQEQKSCCSDEQEVANDSCCSTETKEQAN